MSIEFAGNGVQALFIVFSVAKVNLTEAGVKQGSAYILRVVNDHIFGYAFGACFANVKSGVGMGGDFKVLQTVANYIIESVVFWKFSKISCGS
jgi:hypothetical protein